MRCDHDEGYSLDCLPEREGGIVCRIHCRLCADLLDIYRTSAPEVLEEEFESKRISRD